MTDDNHGVIGCLCGYCLESYGAEHVPDFCPRCSQRFGPHSNIAIIRLSVSTGPGENGGFGINFEPEIEFRGDWPEEERDPLEKRLLRLVTEDE